MLEELSISLSKDPLDWKMLIITGMHGDESHAVKCVIDLYNELKKKKNTIKTSFSKIDFLVGVNQSGLKYNTRDFVEPRCTGLDLNRFEPIVEPDDDYNLEDKQDLQEYILNYIDHGEYDFVLDVHNSPNIKDLIYLDNSKKSTSMIEFLKENHINFLLNNVESSNTLKGVLLNKCVYDAFTVELNQMNLTSEENHNKSLDFLYNFVVALLGRHSSFNSGDFKSNRDYLPVELSEALYGYKYFCRDTPIGDYKKDETICEIRNSKNEVIDEIKAPFDGVLQEVNTSYISFAGNTFGVFSKKWD